VVAGFLGVGEYPAPFLSVKLATNFVVVSVGAIHSVVGKEETVVWQGWMKQRQR
jgi:hypothetical protein